MGSSRSARVCQGEQEVVIHLSNSILSRRLTTNIRDSLQENADGLDIRPTISLTKAHIKISELDAAYTSGSLIPDGKVVHNSLRREGSTADPGVEVNTHKAAVEPVWFLPGLASRFGISEDLLRRCLFEGEHRTEGEALAI